MLLHTYDYNKTNISSLISQRHLTNTTNRLNKYMAQLTGRKLIGRQMSAGSQYRTIRSDISALNQSKKYFGCNFIITSCEGGMVEINNIVVRQDSNNRATDILEKSVNS